MADTTLHKILKGHTSGVNAVAFSPDSKLIASASKDKTIRLWDIPSGDLVAELNRHEGVVFAVAFSPDGKSLVTASADQSVRIWSVEHKQQIRTLEGHSDSVRSVAWSPNGDLIISGSCDNNVIMWDALSLISGTPIKTLRGHTGWVVHVSFSQNGHKLVSAGCKDNTVIIWDVSSGAILAMLLHPYSVYCACFSRDNQFIATACGDSTVRICNANTGREEKQFKGHTDFVYSAAFSFDSSMIVSAGGYLFDTGDYSLRLWDVTSAKQLQRLEEHTDDVNAVAFSRDGKFIASGSGDKTVRLWNTPSSLQTPASLLIAACFAGDVDDAKSQLDQGAPVSSPHDLTALYAASSCGSKQLVKLLLERGADINFRNKSQNTALHVASSNGQLEVVAYLLDCGLSINDKGYGGSTALHLASLQGHAKVVELLINRGAYIMLRDDDGRIALHQGIIGERASVVQILLERGADTNVLDGANQSAKQLARQSKSAEVYATLNQATSLQNKNLKSVPASALEETNQFTLRLGNNKLGPDVWDTLTTSLTCQKFLVGLFLQSNPSLATISNNIVKLGQLLYLSVADCDLSAPSILAVALLPNLRSLNISGNPLGDLPAEFSRLKELCLLNANNCNLSLVPAVITQLLQLHDLDISNNFIHRIPVALASLPHLTRINLSGCPLTAIPSEYHNAPTSELLQFLKDLGQESQPVYRSKLLLVGYGGVGKTTLLSALFPPSAILSKKSPSVMKSMVGSLWEQRHCKIEGSKLVYDRPTKTGGWENAGEIELVGAIVEVDNIDEVSWFIQPKDQSRKYEFRCKTGLEREEWINSCKFQARKNTTDGITVIHRDIRHTELQFAVDRAIGGLLNLAPADWQCVNRIPKDKYLQLAICDFAGRHEYQDGHQLFLTSRSIYLVLWDMTPTKRAVELAKLRHWLVTLQLQLGSDQLRNSVLIYIIGTHADAPDVNPDQCLQQATKIVQAVQLRVPYRMIDAMDVHNQEHVSSLKQQLLADLAVQSHLGEEVPTSYLDLEQQLRVAQDRYREQSTQQRQRNSGTLSTPLLQRNDLALQLKLDIGLVTRGLSLLHLWGQVVYLGELNARSKLGQVVVYLPEWLTVSVFGSLVTEMRKKLDRASSASSALDEANSVSVVKHADLVRFSSVWRCMSSEQREQVMEMLYAFDLGFPESSVDSKSFEDRSSLFPQLLPLKPPRSFTWDRSSVFETARIVELNGIPMGFHTVLLSRLRSYFGGIDSSSSWQSGFVFTQGQVRTLVTIHEDSNRLRFCVRNGQNVAKSFTDLIDVLRQILTDRYKGLHILNEFVECSCEGCRRDHQWQWNRTIANAIACDSSIHNLLKDATARPQSSAAMLLEIQPKGPPFEFNLVDIDKQAPSALCKKFNTAVPLAQLLSSVALG